MNHNKYIALLLIPLLTLSALPSPAAAAEEVKRFCTMDTAVGQLMDKADIPANLQKEPVVRMLAEDLIAAKLAEHPSDTVKIVWKDIYDMRGSVNAWLAQNGHPLNYVGQALDAVGAGLTGTVAGKMLMMNTLMLAGPAGFIMLGGLNITQETFQCNPSGVVMAANAGATIVVLIPWCRVPGVGKGCVALEHGVAKGIEKTAAGLFGKEVTATFLKSTTNGIVMAIKLKSTDLVISGMELLNYLDQRKAVRQVDFAVAIPVDAAIELPDQAPAVNWDSR
ncbi:MAG: hypothetical protein A2X35_01440 [Elusimicrobia bacterium GWA2_61_42]|nr:MAG: hypothetical protein A2X35_01440 [Elusimicrobia bacterium GWA2_61_42]OGR76811.1 MAG: hypothetical protein A2X38_11615 [Elusimicrobia bacterium GWC2_61_25]